MKWSGTILCNFLILFYATLATASFNSLNAEQTDETRVSPTLFSVEAVSVRLKLPMGNITVAEAKLNLDSFPAIFSTELSEVVEDLIESLCGISVAELGEDSFNTSRILSMLISSSIDLSNVFIYDFAFMTRQSSVRMTSSEIHLSEPIEFQVQPRVVCP